MTATPNSAAFQSARIGMAALALLLLAACSTATPPQVDAGRLKQFSGRGYLTDERYRVAASSANLTVGSDSLDIAWTLPTAGSALPVVVYLPGLGESAAAGEHWRTAWAAAGYAVLAVQLLEADQKTWSSAMARRGDFGTLARERYAKSVVTARLKILAALFAELKKHQAADDALVRRLDLSRVALAGFDIGAYTAMRAGGESQGDATDPVRLPIAIAAVIALSPHADFSGSPFSSRYQGIALPVLSVSGDADTDAFGIVSSPSVRKAPFEYMPGHNAYLLWLAHATHADLAGSASIMADEATDRDAKRGGEGEGPAKGGARRGGRKGGGGQPSRAAEEKGATRSGPAQISPTDRAMGVSLIQGVTTAFLDAYVKQDAIAQEWLKQDAMRWIGDRGELKWK